MSEVETMTATGLPQRERVCAQCSHSAREGRDRQCRFNPPTVFAFMVPAVAMGPDLTPQQTLQLQATSCFPTVRDDQWCDKFTRRADA